MRARPRYRLRAFAPLILALCACEPDAAFDHYVLALSWQPAFCEANAERPECRSLAVGDFAARNLALHGLWPSASASEHPAYCGVAAAARDLDIAGQWCALPTSGADQETQDDLAQLMPGARSCLDRHEWLKHGTCSGLDADAYFDRSARLTEAVQATRLGALLSAHVGREIPLRDILDAFQEEFGPSAGAALTVTCRRTGGRAYLAEIRLALRPEALDKPLSGNSLFTARGDPRGGCPSRVVIDRAGPG